MDAHPEPLPLPPAPPRLPRPRAGLLIAVLLLSFVLGLAWLVAGQWQSESSRAALEDLRARSVRLHHLDTLLLQMLDAESSVRGYLLTQNPAYLTPYQDGQADLERTLGALLTAAKLDAGWIARKLPAEAVAPLRSRFDRLLDTLNQGIALKRKVVADLRAPLLSELGLIEAPPPPRPIGPVLNRRRTIPTREVKPQPAPPTPGPGPARRGSARTARASAPTRSARRSVAAL